MLTRPPYLRWAAAAAILTGAVLWELSSSATVLVPTARQPIGRGTVIDADDIVWKEVRGDTMTPIDPVGTTAMVEIVAGDPIIASLVTAGIAVPDGWWTVPADVPHGATRGSSVRVVLADGFGVTGVVVEPSTEDGFGIMSAGLIAIPPSASDLVALAASAGELVVLFEP